MPGSWAPDEMEDIQRLMDAAGDPTSENQVTLDNVRRWLPEYIGMRADEVARFPSEANLNYWDLLAADYDSSSEAHFVAAYFADGRVTFLAGRGPIPEVRAFALNDFPDNPADVLDALARRFTTGDCWTTSADEVIAWAQDQ